MNYLIWSHLGCAVYAIPRLQKSKETEKVYWFNQDMEQKRLARGMEKYPGWEKLEITTDPMKVLNHADKKNMIVIFDDNGFGGMADNLRKQGFMVVGGSEIADRMEGDRWWSIQLAMKVMDVPETAYFDTFSDGLIFLKKVDKNSRWVFKPQDPDVPKEKTYVSKDVADLTETMARFKEEWCWKDGFVLQEFIEGTMSSFGAYFNGTDWIENSFFWYLENKPFMNGDIGQATGGEIAVQVWRKNEGKAFEILNKLKPVLKKYGYRGELDINAIFSEKDHKPYFLEFTPRFGYPGMDMEITALEDTGKNFTDLIDMLAKGENKAIFPTNKIAVTLGVSIAPYPNHQGAAELAKGVPIKWGKEWDMYFFPTGLMYDEDFGMVEAGVSGQVCQVTCCADTLKSALDYVYNKYMPTLEVKDKQYRTDLGVDAGERLKKLKGWGWIK